MIHLIHESKTPLYQQIYEQVREEILSGTSRAGSKLSPIRILAANLGVSRNTVEAAYAQLTQEGFVAAHPGSGYIVQKVESISQGNDGRQRAATKDFVGKLPRDFLWHEDDRVITKSAEHNERWYDFTYGNLSDTSFPAQTWRKLTNEVLSGSEINTAATYNNPLGEQSLRRQIAHYLKLHRGVNCHPAQVIIQPGMQGGLYNLLTLFDAQRDVVAMEDPGYDGARVVFENAGHKLYPIPVLSRESERIDSYYASKAKLAYLTPSNQFPTGGVLEISARQALINWARSTNAYLIEDDYCCEYGYTVRPLPSLQSLDLYNRVIYMGTFSKALSPALRLSYLVLPPDLLFAWSKAFARHYSEVPWMSQAVLEAYMRLGHWEKQVRRVQATHKRKYNLLKSSIRKYMGEQVDVMEDGSGLHLLVGVHDGRKQGELIVRACANGVKVYETHRYWMTENHPLQSYLLVGFSAIQEERIAEGVSLLADAWFD